MSLLCYNCSTEITWKKRRIAHINVCQKPSILYFCNQDCKLNWIFKKSDVKIGKAIGDDWIKDEANSILEMAVIRNNTDELDDYLKENGIKILREA